MNSCVGLNIHRHNQQQSYGLYDVSSITPNSIPLTTVTNSSTTSQHTTSIVSGSSSPSNTSRSSRSLSSSGGCCSDDQNHNRQSNNSVPNSHQHPMSTQNTSNLQQSVPDYFYPRRRLYPAIPNRTFICTRAHKIFQEGELELRKGDIVELLSVGDAGYWEGNHLFLFVYIL